MTFGRQFAGFEVDVKEDAPSTLFLAALLSDMGARVVRAGSSVPRERLEELLARSVGHPQPATVRVSGEAFTFSIAFILDSTRAFSGDFTDAAAWSLGGLASLTGDSDGPPLAPGSPIAAYCAALHALLAIVAARYAGLRETSIEVGLADVVGTLLEVAGLQYAADGSVRGRTGDYWGRAGWGLYDCADGPVAIALRDTTQLHAFGRLMGNAELTSSRYADFAWGICALVDEVNAHIIGGLLELDIDAVVAYCRNARIACARVPALPDLLDDPHLNARDAFQVLGQLKVPRVPLRSTRDELLPRNSRHGPADRPLSGLRVLDISSVWAGPMAARLLADLGASVMKVSPPKKRVGSYASGGANWDRDFYSILNDHNKTAVEANLKLPEERDAFGALVREADVLIENFIPGSLQRLGLSHQHLLELNPNLTVVAMPAMGLDGPDAAAAGYGSTIEQSAGIGQLYADAGMRAHRSGVNFSDPIAGLWAAVGTILGSLAGGGRVVEVSQQEAALSLVRPALAAFQLGAGVPRAIEANRDEESGEWWFPLFSGTTMGGAPVRSVAEVMGAPGSAAFPCIEWHEHPNGVAFPLPRLPWKGELGSGTSVEVVKMPQPLVTAQW